MAPTLIIPANEEYSAPTTSAPSQLKNHSVFFASPLAISSIAVVAIIVFGLVGTYIFSRWRLSRSNKQARKTILPTVAWDRADTFLPSGPLMTPGLLSFDLSIPYLLTLPKAAHLKDSKYFFPPKPTPVAEKPDLIVPQITVTPPAIEHVTLELLTPAALEEVIPEPVEIAPAAVKEVVPQDNILIPNVSQPEEPEIVELLPSFVFQADESEDFKALFRFDSPSSSLESLDAVLSPSILEATHPAALDIKGPNIRRALGNISKRPLHAGTRLNRWRPRGKENISRHRSTFSLPAHPILYSINYTPV